MRKITNKTNTDTALIFNKYYNDLVLFGYLFSNNQNDIEDSIQESFKTLILQTQKDEEIKNIKSYLFTSVKNKLINIHKHQKVKNNFAQLKLDENLGNLEDEIIQSEATNYILDILKNLPNDQRKIMELSIQGLNYTQIAETLGISDFTVRNKRKMVVDKLRNLFILFTIFLQKRKYNS